MARRLREGLAVEHRAELRALQRRHRDTLLAREAAAEREALAEARVDAGAAREAAARAAQETLLAIDLSERLRETQRQARRRLPREGTSLRHTAQASTTTPPSLPYKVDTSRPSLHTNWTRLVPLHRAGEQRRRAPRQRLAAQRRARRADRGSLGSPGPGLAPLRALQGVHQGTGPPLRPRAAEPCPGRR